MSKLMDIDIQWSALQLFKYFFLFFFQRIEEERLLIKVLGLFLASSLEREVISHANCKPEIRSKG